MPEEVKKEDSPKLLRTQEPKFVRQKRRKKILAGVLLVSFAGCVTMGIIAFLGHNFGRFTIVIDDSQKDALTLSNTISETKTGEIDPSSGEETSVSDISSYSSYLDVDGFSCKAPTEADELPLPSEVDADKKEGEAYSLTDERGTYWAFTFYVKNVSEDTVNYAMKLYFASVTEPSNLADSCSLESILRIRVFENDLGSPNNTFITYARRTSTSANEQETSGWTDREYVSRKDAKYDYNTALATNFASDDDNDPESIVVFNDEKEIAFNTIRRYSILMWLEGNDPDCKGARPNGGSIELAVSISAL